MKNISRQKEENAGDRERDVRKNLDKITSQLHN